jgi:3-hydroxyisobutyrate dehydrogenase-like beta-hydroxyacid dehydrogenase
MCSGTPVQEHDDMSPASPLGFIGLGAMGGAMVRTLMRAGHAVLGFDIDGERLAASAADGLAPAASNADVVCRCDVVLTSLRSSAVWVEVAEADLVPHARRGQTFIDLGTVAAPQSRRLAAAFAAKGARLLDAPVSGGPHGSETGTLRIFVGGDRAAYERHRPLLETLGEPERVVYCGPSGCGQAVKGANQLAMGIADAAYLEALAFGVRAGADIEAIRQGVGGTDGWRAHFAHLATRVIEGQADHCYIKFPEFPYFLAEAEAGGFPLPITEALYEFCRAGHVAFFDNMRRPTVSLWRELMTRAVDTSEPQD